jgi:YHS domain-containing protein
MRKFKVLTTTLTFFMLLAFAVAAFAAAQTTCPVMGGTINKKLYVDYKGERVYFCCQACLPQFKKDPEKFIKKMKEMGQEPEKIPSDK